MRTAVTHAWRAWKTGAGTAALAACAFAIGIGGATAIYSVVHGVMLKPLPYADGDRFVALYQRSFSQPEQRGTESIQDLLQYQHETRTFAVLGWFPPSDYNITIDGHPERVVGVALTPPLALALGVRPVAGTWFHDDTEVVVSGALARRLGGGTNIVGHTLTLNGHVLTIAGVMPPAFRMPIPGPGVERVDADLWISLDPAGRGQDQTNAAYFSYAKLQPGVSLDQANADVARIAAVIAAADPAHHPSYTAKLDDLRAVAVADIRSTIVLLAASAALLFLVACADVAGLLLARALGRTRDTAVRVALGASQRQLAAQYFFEGLLVALPGAAAGILVSGAFVRAILTIAADQIPRADGITVDWTVVAFAAGAAAIASGLAALAPLRLARRTSAGTVLTVGGRASGGSASSRLSRALVGVEIALAFALVAAGAALVVDLRVLGRLSTGFDPDGLVTFELSMAEGANAASADKANRLLTAIDAVPGVTSAAVTNQLPLRGCCFAAAVYPDERPPGFDAATRTSLLAVSPAYQRTLRIPLISGRFLDAHDTSEDPLIAVVNEAAVRTYWPDGDPIDRSGRLGAPEGPRFHIVGVIGDVRNDGLSKPTVPEVYVSASVLFMRPVNVVVRSTRPRDSLVPDIRRAIANVDPDQPIHDLSTMDVIRANSMSVERVGSVMVGFFAVAALVMAALGLYGVISYSVRQRTVEIGTRMALGASAGDLLRMVFMEGLTIALYGGGAGAIAILALSILVVHVSALPAVGLVPFVLSALLVLAITSSASLVPAARTALLPPIVAIRDEPGTGWGSSTPMVRHAWSVLTGSRALEDTTGLEGIGPSIDMVAATRQATSFQEAFEGALIAICASVGAASALLLELEGASYRCIARTRDDVDADCSLPANGVLARRLRFRRSALPFDQGDLDAWRAHAGSDDGPLAEINVLAGHSVRVAVPLRAKRDITGMLLVGLPVGRAAYSSAERRALTRAADLLTMMMENAGLTRRVVAQDKLLRDVALAAEVQRRLLPDGPPAGHGDSLAGASVPARTIGGDYYDFLDLGERGIGIALADVSGKGVPAALIMAAVHSSLRIVASDRQLSLPELAAKLNACLHQTTRAASYATFFYAQVDPGARQLRYVNAGHNPPYLLRTVTLPPASSSERIAIQELPAGGTVLGLFPGMRYEETILDLQPGDVLVAFTDGVIEALNADEQEFGEERLKELLRSIAHLPAPNISSRISETLRQWIAGAVQYDDMTFVVMKVGASSSDAVVSAKA